MLGYSDPFSRCFTVVQFLLEPPASSAEDLDFVATYGNSSYIFFTDITVTWMEALVTNYDSVVLYELAGMIFYEVLISHHLTLVVMILPSLSLSSSFSSPGRGSEDGYVL